MAGVVTIVVHIALWFDPSIRSHIVRTTAATEAAAVWRDYGVVLEFGAGADAQLCTRAFVARTRAPSNTTVPSVLGSTVVPDHWQERSAPIRIGFDSVDELAQPSESANPMIHEYAVGTAIGRVLAHEVGHILLGAPSYHDSGGLMRSNFASDDFLPWNRSRYRLESGSVERLRQRMSALSTRDAPLRCSAS